MSLACPKEVTLWSITVEKPIQNIAKYRSEKVKEFNVATDDFDGLMKLCGGVDNIESIEKLGKVFTE